MTASKLGEPTLALRVETPAPWQRFAREALRYFGCSALALALDAGLFGLGLRLGINYPLAAALGFVAGLALAYKLSVRFVFKDRRLQDARAEFLVFACIGLGGLMVTELLLWLFIGEWNWFPASAKLLTAGVVFCFNFSARKALLFTLPRASL
jgi:putative flippase GtrA